MNPADRHPLRFRGSRGPSPGALKLVAEFKSAGKPRVYRFIERGVEEDYPQVFGDAFGSRPSGRAACGVSPVPASIPIAKEKP